MKKSTMIPVKPCLLLTFLLFCQAQQMEWNQNSEKASDEAYARKSYENVIYEDEFRRLPYLDLLDFFSDSEVNPESLTTSDDPEIRENNEAMDRLNETVAEVCASNITCQNEEVMKHIQFKKIQQKLLKGLEMDTPPVITDKFPSRNSSVVQEMVRKYYKNQEQARIRKERLEESIETVSIPSQTMPYDDHAEHTEGRLYFTFSEAQRRDFVLKSAKLFYYVKPYDFYGRFPTFIEYYKEKNDTNGGFVVSPTLYDKPQEVHFHLRKSQGFWRRKTVTTLAKKWFEDPDRNHGVRVYVRNHSNAIANGTNTDFEPYLEVNLATAPNSRRKRRGLPKINCDSSITTCCRYDLKITFEKIGFNWVIAPDYFFTNVCRGSCSVLDMISMRGTLLDHVGHSGAGDCCVPTVYEPLTILYYDNHSNIVCSEVPDMVITECGCA